MPFNDLSDIQKKFIQTYLKSSKRTFREKSKDKIEKINDAIKDAVTPVLERIDSLQDLINEVEAKYQDSPVVGFESMLTQARTELAKILDAHKKEIKKGEMPSLSPVTSQLDNLEDLIKRRIEQEKSGKGRDQLAGSKEAHMDSVYLRVDTEKRLSEEVISTAIRDMPILLQFDYDKRTVAITKWRQHEADTRANVNKLASEHIGKPETDLSNFQQIMKQAVDGFVQKGGVELDVLRGLLRKDPFDFRGEKAKFATDDKYKDQAFIQRELIRNAAVEKEKERMGKALKNQRDEAAALKQKFKDAPRDQKKEIEAAYKAKQGDVIRLEMREQQLVNYEAMADERQRTLVRAVLLEERATADAYLIFEGLEDFRPDNIVVLNEKVLALQSRPNGFISFDDRDAALEAIQNLEDEIELAAKREVVVAKLDKSEPKMMELSEKQKDALLKLLKCARLCVDAECFDHATALVDEVALNLFKFKIARQAVALPPPEPPAPSDGEKVVSRLNFMVAQCRDLGAQNVAGANALADEIGSTLDHVKLALKASSATDLAGYRNEADVFARRIDGLPPLPPRSREMAKTMEAVGKTSDEVNKILSDLLKTKPITDSDIIEQPGITYSKAEQKKLVRADEIIYVRNDQGELERHKILQNRKAKGGEDLSQRSDKKVPRESTDLLRQKSETLRLMMEMAGDDTGDAVEEYRKEVETLAREISEKGDDLYPKAEALVKSCTKLFNKKPLSEYMPENYGRDRAPFDQLKDSWRSMAPQAAFDKATAHKATVDQLVKDSAKVQEAYVEAVALQVSIRKDLTGKKNKSDDSDPLGKLMKETLKKRPEELFKGASSGGDLELTKKLAVALVNFKNLQDFYSSNSQILSSDTMSGDWLVRCGNALKKMNAKDFANVKEATDDLKKIRKDMSEFTTQMEGLTSKDEANLAKGDEMAKLLLALIDKMWASGKAANDLHKERRQFLLDTDALKKKIEDGRKLAGKKGKNPQAKLVDDQLKGIKSQLDSLVSSMKTDENWSEGSADASVMDKQADRHIAQLGGLEKDKAEKIKNMRIGNKPAALEKIVSDMKTHAKSLIDEDIVKLVPGLDIGAQTTTLKTVTGNLAGVDSLPNLTELKKIAARIDLLNTQAEAGTNTKKQRMEERERILAETRKFRNSVETHPSVELYRSNPFDKGTDVRLIHTALHQVEIAALACVSPREKDAV
jgi:hypothetical protein